MWHKPCRTFHPWCPCIKTRCLSVPENHCKPRQSKGTRQDEQHPPENSHDHYSDVIMSAVASQIAGVSIVCSAVCLGADQWKYQCSVPLAFVRGTTGHQWISLTKGQWPGKGFHLMTSSCLILRFLSWIKLSTEASLRGLCWLSRHPC